MPRVILTSLLLLDASRACSCPGSYCAGTCWGGQCLGAGCAPIPVATPTQSPTPATTTVAPTIAPPTKSPTMTLIAPTAGFVPAPTLLDPSAEPTIIPDISGRNRRALPTVWAGAGCAIASVALLRAALHR